MKPRIFVSSTFYDLKYIREDLSNFIKLYNFEPLLFEEGDIGFVSGKQLDSSCYEALKDADMVVLIIGGQYGSAASGENEDEFNEYISITRREFQTASNEAIPIFAFVDTAVFNEFGVYEQNYKAIESGTLKINFKVTKNINVFRFIKELKNIGNIPMIDFCKSAQIKGYLKQQWADMFKNYLELLKTKKRDDLIKSSIAQIGTLTEQINMMVDGLGEEFLGEDNKYNKIILQQDNLWVKIACEIIANKIAINSNDKHRQEVIHALIEQLNIQYRPATTMELLFGGDCFYNDDYSLRNEKNFRKTLEQRIKPYNAHIILFDESIICDYVLHKVFGEKKLGKKVETMMNKSEFSGKIFK